MTNGTHPVAINLNHYTPHLLAIGCAVTTFDSYAADYNIHSVEYYIT